LKKLQSSEPLITGCTNRNIFRQNSAQTAIFSAKTVSKNAGKSAIVLGITACE
jgi:hypothetical protein